MNATDIEDGDYFIQKLWMPEEYTKPFSLTLLYFFAYEFSIKCTSVHQFYRISRSMLREAVKDADIVFLNLGESLTSLGCDV